MKGQTAMKEIFPKLYGNGALKARLGKSLLAPIPDTAHAYIIEGAKGIGKHTLALTLAASLVCEARGDGTKPLPCGVCENCRKIYSRICPDIIEIGRDGDKASLGVDAIRALKGDVCIYPNDLDLKFYIINDADTMTVQAQNAFLLTLEEPPAYVVFLLLCESAASLLETVRSRAPVLRMQPLTTDELASALREVCPSAGKDGELFDAAVMASGGSLGRAVELLSGDASAEVVTRRRAAAKFCLICSDKKKSAEALSHLCAVCTTSRDEAIRVLSDIELAFRDLCLLKKSPTAPLRFYTDREAASELSDTYPLRRLLAFSEEVALAIELLEKNMNVRLTLISLLSRTGMMN